MSTWLDNYVRDNDPDKSALVRFRGGVGVKKGRITTSHFVGHPVHYLDEREWKPITLTHNNGKFEGIDFGWNGRSVTYKGKPLFEPQSITFNGVARPLNFFLDAPNHRLVAFVQGVGEYVIQFSERGVKEILTIPEPLDGELAFQVAHATKPKELHKAERKVTGRDDLKGNLYQLTKDMNYPLEIDPDYSGTTGDGVVYGDSATYATARTTSSGYDTTATTMTCGQNTTYRVWKNGLKIDTSGIPDGDSVTQANLKMVCTADTSVTDFDIVIKKHDWSAQDPIAAGTREAFFDGVNAASADDNIWRNTSGIVTNTQYESGNLNTAWISKTSYTYYSLQSSRDVSATAPTGNEYIAVATQNHGTSAYRPVLTVEHSAGGSTFAPRLALLGVGR